MLTLVALGGCRTYPMPDPPLSVVSASQHAAWSAAQDPVPARLLGAWRSLADGDRLRLGADGLYRRRREGQGELIQGACRVKGDRLYLHRQVVGPNRAIEPILLEYRFTVDRERLQLEWVDGGQVRRREYLRLDIEDDLEEAPEAPSRGP